jgi:hypothetical protein
MYKISRSHWQIYLYMVVTKTEFICAAAVKTKRGLVYIGARHDECYKEIMRSGFTGDCLECEYASIDCDKGCIAKHWGSIAGFITNKGRFMDRFEAFDFAEKNSQLLFPNLHSNDNRYLTSEDLW